MNLSKTHKGIFGSILGIATAAAVITMIGNVNAQEQQMDMEMDMGAESEAVITVGTYNPQAAFEQHPAQADLMETVQKLQAQVQQAQSEGDQQAMQQLQQQFQQQRQQVITQFESDVQQALPEAAEAAGVKIVAVQVVYTADDVATKDITPQLIESFEEAGGEESPLQSGFQFGQPQQGQQEPQEQQPQQQQ